VNADGKALTTFPGLTRDESEFISFLKTGQFLQISQARIEASALTRASY
jgi:hypothetical protein